MSRIDTIIIDCDGVLNDGKQAHIITMHSHHSYNVVEDENGGFMTQKDPNYWATLEKPFKTFHARDKTAIRHLTENGIRVIIVSADDSPITKAWAESCGAEFVHERIKTLEGYGINWETSAGIGDDRMDLVFLEKCARVFCPKDCHNEVKRFILQKGDKYSGLSSGGSGIIPDMVDILKNSLSLTSKSETHEH